jgi:hypothetical protein
VLSSVQSYVKGIIDGLVVPTFDQPLQAWITEPVLEDLDSPKAYVWGARMQGGRQTAPRGPAFKRLPWEMDITLGWMDTPDDALAREPFPLVVDAVLWALWTTTMPKMITDPVTTRETQIQAIAEDFALDYAPVALTDEGEGMILYAAKLTISVLEVVQA